MEIKRKHVESHNEKNMLTGLITSDTFCRDILPIVKPEFLQIEYSKIIVNWVREYFDRYGKAPGKDIENIFLAKAIKLKPEVTSLLQKYLTNLSENYDELANINEEYVLDQTINFLKHKGLTFHTDKISSLLSMGEIEEAEQEIANYREIAKATSQWVNPFDEEYIKKALNKDQNYLFKMSGVLGQLMGPLKREWLIALMGPMKRGKTFYLQEIMFHAMQAGLKVVMITLEMQDEDLSTRGYKRLTGFTDEGGKVIFPVFDCKRNQTGECEKERRTNHVTLVDEHGDVPQYDEDLEYTVCTKCREKEPKEYDVAVWYETHDTEEISTKGVIDDVKDYQMMYSSNLLRIKAYPMKSANMKDIKRDLDLLEYSENWIPDVVIIDYADILGTEDSRLTGREATNETWMGLKSMAQKRKCLVVTATQSNRASIESKNVRQTNTGEDIRKIAHVDVMPVLNQTPLEKRMGIMRVGIIAHRHKMSDEFIQAEILQQLKAGQAYLDGELLFDKSEE